MIHLKKLLLTLICACCLVLPFGFVGCGENPYDLSGVQVVDTTVTYDGQTKSINIVGTIPEKVKTTTFYYKDQTRYQKITIPPVDAGVYYATVNFYKDNDEFLEEKLATLTINKAEIKTTDISFGVGVYDGEDIIPMEATVGADGNFHLPFDFKEYVPLVLSSTFDQYNLKYYSALNSDGTPDATAEIVANKIGIRNYTDKLYVAATFGDKNHNTKVVISPAYTIDRKVFEINNQDDLLQVNKDIYEYPLATDRANFVYRLMADIDLGGLPWQTISPIFNQTDADANMSTAFCSEFDGNGHRVHNFQLVKESLTYDLTLADGSTKHIDGNVITFPGLANHPSGLGDTQYAHLGFFGYAIAANIHDLVLDNVTVNFLHDGECEGHLLFYGTLLARAEKDVNTYNILGRACTSIWNITIKNVNATLMGQKIYAGGVIGWDNNRNDAAHVFKRENLDTENVNIGAYSQSKLTLLWQTLGTPRLSVGGIVGETQGSNVTCYEGCDVVGGILRSSHLIYNMIQDFTNGFWWVPWETYGQVSVYVGGLAGRTTSAGIEFKQCSSSATVEMYCDTAEHLEAGYNNNGLVGASTHEVQQSDCEFSGEVKKYILGVLQQDSAEE